MEKNTVNNPSGSQLGQVDHESNKLFRNIKSFLTTNFKKEIEEDKEIEKRYRLNHTEEEVQYRKELQEKYLIFHKQKNRAGTYNGLRKAWKWLRKYYLNFEIKDTFESYEYAHHMRSNFMNAIFVSFMKATGLTFGIFLWMRLIKHKGKKDLLYLTFVNFFISLNWLSLNCYHLLMKTHLPLNTLDIDRRKELIEDFVFGNNKSIVLSEEIKKISRYYVPQKIEFSFVTSLGQKVTLIAYKGRLYLSCDNYAEVFGYGGKNKLAKMDVLNVTNLREREIIYGMFKFYDVLIEEYKKKYKVKEGVNLNTQIFEEIAKEKNLTKEHLEYIKNSRLLKDVQFKSININSNFDARQNTLSSQNKKI